MWALKAHTNAGRPGTEGGEADKVTCAHLSGVGNTMRRSQRVRR